MLQNKKMSTKFSRNQLEQVKLEADTALDSEARPKGPSVREIGKMFSMAVGLGLGAGYLLPPVVNTTLESLNTEEVRTIDVEQLDKDPQRVIVVVRHDVEKAQP